MSWDADLVDDATGTVLLEQNYTHNTNAMIEAALTAGGMAAALAGTPASWWACARTMGSQSWWQLLDHATGPDGSRMLTALVAQLEADPDRYRAMDPPNGWGSYDTLLPVLRRMRDAGLTERPCTWRVYG